MTLRSDLGRPGQLFGSSSANAAGQAVSIERRRRCLQLPHGTQRARRPRIDLIVFGNEKGRAIFRALHLAVCLVLFGLSSFRSSSINNFTSCLYMMFAKTNGSGIQPLFCFGEHLTERYGLIAWESSRWNFNINSTQLTR